MTENGSSLRAFITGGSRGIGKATVAAFEERGYEVVAPTRAELDLLSRESIAAYLAEHAGERFDTVVNNAGINDITAIEDADDTTIERMFSVDLIAPVLLLRGLIPSLKKSSCGRIVNIGSIWASVSKPGRGLYSAAKNGIHGLTNALAVELGPDGILVNTVCPGFTATELTVQNNTPEQIKSIEREIPLQRMARPEEIASVVCFLGSDANTYITGQKIMVDGGFTAR